MKTKRDGQTDSQDKTDRRTDRQTDGGRCNISRPGPSAPREIKIGGCDTKLGNQNDTKLGESF